MRIKNKSIIVTGAGGGIGEGIARRMAAEGALVIVNDINVTMAEAVVAAIVKAGVEAGKVGRDLESSADMALLQQLEKEGKLHIVAFKDRAKLLELAEPVKQAYAKDIGATDILTKVNSIK